MDFSDARALDSLCFQMRQADYPRSLNRARINNLYDGFPPYSEKECDENGIEVNVNENSGIVVAHDARSQFYNGFLKPGNYFTATTDAGAKHKRPDYGKIATREVNKIMKRSIEYVECFRSKFAMDVLHGIAPSGWRDADCWCPDAWGIEDVMVPANTLLTMRNLPFFAVYHSFTAPELIKLTRGPNPDPAWNMPLVNACIDWVDSQTMALMGTNWPEIWSPEKAQQRVKGDGGFYVGDQVPTIDCWDVYFWNDKGKKSGWNRRMILDSWSSPANEGSLSASTFSRRSGKIYDKPWQGEFLYNPKDRKWADNLSEIVTWQFADLSAVAPFKYHSVRSLGFLLYAVCHLQNRLYSKISEAQFEQLMVYFRVKSADEMQRALRVDLVNRGFIDDSIEFVKAQDRYQVNAPFIQQGMDYNSYIIGRNSASYTSTPNQSQDKRELTATQWMGEANKVTALVSSALNQAYLYQNKEYREIFRRFVRKGSKDPEVRTFQAKCLKQGVPEKVLYNPECWDLEPERVVGAGNKTLEMAVAEWLITHINLYEPESQRLIKRTATLAITDDPALTDALVPEQPRVTDTIHDAQLAAGALLQGLPVAIKGGINHIEYVEALLASMAVTIQRITQTDNMGTIGELLGLQNMADHIGQHIAIIGQDQAEKQRVKQYGDQLGKLMNLVKAFAQRLEEQMASQAQGNGHGPDPETLEKIENMRMLTEAKAANTRSSHAERTAQRQIAFEMKSQQDQQKAQADLQIQAAKSATEIQTKAATDQIELAKQAALAEIDIRKSAAKAKEKPKASE